MNGAQQTFVKMHAKIPRTLPFTKDQMVNSEAMGIAKATVHEKKIRNIQEVIRLVCFTQT
jgi:hypothetical protein